MTEVETVVIPIPIPVPWFRSGMVGWILLATGVLMWDILAPESLSDSFHRARQHPASKLVVVGAWGVLTLHLFGKIPERADPFHMITVAKNHVRHLDLECCADPWDA